MDNSLGTDIAQDLPFPARSWQRAKSECVEGPVWSPSLWVKGRGEDVLLTWLLGMLSLPTPSQPSAPCCEGWIEALLLFKEKHMKLVDWLGWEDLFESDLIHTHFLHACLIIGRWAGCWAAKLTFPSLLKQGPLCALLKRAWACKSLAKCWKRKVTG